MLSQDWEAILHLKILVELFHILLFFYHFYPGSTFMENVEETFKIKEYSSPWYCIDLWSRRINSDRKKYLFFGKFYSSPRVTYLRREHIFLTLFTNTIRQSFTTQTPSTWNFTQTCKMLLLTKKRLHCIWVLEIMIDDWVTKGYWKLDMVSSLVNQSIAKTYHALNNFSLQ